MEVYLYSLCMPSGCGQLQLELCHGNSGGRVDLKQPLVPTRCCGSISVNSGGRVDLQQTIVPT